MIDIPASELAHVFGSAEISEITDLRGRSFASAVGVWRVRGAGGTAVLKLLRLNAGPHPKWPSRAEPSDPYYWRREALAYQSTVLEVFNVPELLGCAERDDGSVALWLEDAGDPKSLWAPEELYRVARRLGTAQSELIGFDAHWLAHGWLREYFRLHGLPLDDGVLDQLDRIPQTLCHNDFHPGNLLASETLIDWSFCGVGPVGMDAGTLVGDGLSDAKFALDAVDDVLDAVWVGYSNGLGDASDEVRFGFVQGVRRLRWLIPGRSPEWDAVLKLIERLELEG